MSLFLLVILAASFAEEVEGTDPVEGADPVEGTDPAEGADPVEGTEPGEPEDQASSIDGELELGWITIDVPVDFGSALDTVTEDAARIEAVDEGLIAALGDGLSGSPVPRAYLRARWFVRPRLTVVGMDSGGWTAMTGGVLGHQWWALEDWTVKPVGETQLAATFPVAGASGQDLVLVTTAGAWVGPVGCLVGPSLRWDRLQFEAGGEVARAWTLGPQLRLAGRIGPLTGWISATPAWLLGGVREPMARLSGDELEVGAGVEISARPITLRLSGTRRELAASVLWGGTLGLHLRLL